MNWIPITYWDVLFGTELHGICPILGPQPPSVNKQHESAETIFSNLVFSKLCFLNLDPNHQCYSHYYVLTVQPCEDLSPEKRKIGDSLYLQRKIIEWRESPLPSGGSNYVKSWPLIIPPSAVPQCTVLLQHVVTRLHRVRLSGSSPLYHAGDRAPWNPGATVKLGKRGWDDTAL